MALIPGIPAVLEGKLIVSCQALEGDPLDDVHALSRIALDVIAGGAGGLRANGARDIAAFRSHTSLPIIGIVKRFIAGKRCITPSLAEAAQAVRAGSDIVGVDCSHDRIPQAEPWPALIAGIHTDLHRPVLADISTYDEALAAEDAGADAVATTLSGYTAATAGRRSVDWVLLGALTAKLSCPVIAEGHIREPAEARRAFDAGAFAVVVGAAITSPRAIAARFVAALDKGAGATS